MLLTSFQLLVFGVLFICAFSMLAAPHPRSLRLARTRSARPQAPRRVALWMHRRGWIRWKMQRGTSRALGNAVLGVQSIFQPPIQDVIEVRLDEASDQGESGDPPEPGEHDDDSQDGARRP